MSLLNKLHTLIILAAVLVGLLLGQIPVVATHAAFFIYSIFDADAVRLILSHAPEWVKTRILQSCLSTHVGREILNQPSSDLKHLYHPS